MTHRIKVTGFLTIEDKDFDDGPNGPLTSEAFDELVVESGGQIVLDDLKFEEDPE